MPKKTIKILAISGSLRPNSSNNIIIHYIAGLTPAHVQFHIFEGLGDIPAFNDSNDAPAPVSNFRHLLANADAIFICTPEYAFGVPGALKNALDWTVSSGELDGKPLAIVTAATGGEKAHAAFLLIFKALSCKIPEGGALLIPFVRSKFNAQGEVSDPLTREAIKSVLYSLIGFVEERGVKEEINS